MTEGVATFVYGYDPICGWCYGAAPAVRAVSRFMPVRLAMAGLVVGSRVGPAAAMEDYVRGAAQRLHAVTGRQPSEAFYAWMRAPSSIAASGPPAVAIHAVLQQEPDVAVAFAHALTEAHYEEGMDLNHRQSYKLLLDRLAPSVLLPDILDPELEQAAFAEGRRLGIQSFPTFMIEKDGAYEELPTLYQPDSLVEAVKQRISI